MPAPRPTPETAALLDLVRVAHGLEPRGPLEPVDQDVLDRSITHGVASEVLAAAPEAGVAPEVEPVLTEWRRAHMLRGLRSATALAQVAGAMDAGGVRYAVFKGVALGVLTGRTPSERYGVDIDLLVRTEDLIATEEALSTLGFSVVEHTFPPLGADPRTRFLTWSSCELTMARDRLQIDVHWRLFPGHVPGLATDELVRDAVPVEVAGAQVLTLGPDAALAHVALNGAKDYWCQLRSVVDAHLLVSRAGASWERARAMAPNGPAFDELQAGVEVLTTGSAPASPALDTWLDGVEGRLLFDERGRPPGGWAAHLRRLATIWPGWESAAASFCHYLVPPASLADPRLPPRWWWVEAAVHRPVKIARLVVFGKDPARR